MAASLDREAFFDAVRAKPFPKRLTAPQVSGMEAILDACPVDFPTDHLAYCLGTTFHETAATMLPIKEYGSDAYFTKRYDPKGANPSLAKTLGNTKAGDGALFCGRGFVQLTGRRNYAKATKRLHELGYLDASLDLEATPRLALEPGIAAVILFVGCTEGWFTGKKLADYFSAGKADWSNARRIINGLDKAATIATYGKAFAAALSAGGYKPGAVTKAVPVPQVDVAPLPAPNAVAEAIDTIETSKAPATAVHPADQSWWSLVVDLLKRTV